MRLQGKTALITGSSRGIGQAVALAFAHEGADIVVNYIQSEIGARKVAAQIEKMGRQVIQVKADVSSKNEVEMMVSKTEDTFGKIDILVNNAAVLLPFNFENPNYVAWQQMVDVNVKGILLCSRAVADVMLRHGKGKIINIVIKETRGSLDYGMTKAAGDILTRGLARELAPSITVNAIAPGFIDTGWISKLSPDEKAAIKEKIPLKRWGTPEDVARAAVFLASDDSDWMTGTTILIDGGDILG